MTPEQLVEFTEAFYGKNIEIMKRKNADYSGGASDPFANFKSVAMLGIGVEEGFLTRMMDKMMRISSFVKKGELQVKDESVTDTLADLANYSALLAAYIADQKKEKAVKTGTRVHKQLQSKIEGIVAQQAEELKDDPTATFNNS